MPNNDRPEPDSTTMMLCEAWVKLYIDWSATQRRYKVAVDALRRAAGNRLNAVDIDTVETSYGYVKMRSASVTPRYDWAVIDTQNGKLAEITTRLESLLNSEVYLPLRQGDELTEIIGELRGVQAIIADARTTTLRSGTVEFAPFKNPPVNC